MLNYGPSFSSLHRLLRMTGLQLRFLVIVPAGNIMDSNIYNSVCLMHQRISVYHFTEVNENQIRFE